MRAKLRVMKGCLLVACLLFSALSCAQISVSDEVADLQQRAEQGDAQAQNDLGFMYANGQGVPQDDAEAVRLFRLLAEQGLALAQNHLGR